MVNGQSIFKTVKVTLTIASLTLLFRFIVNQIGALYLSNGMGFKYGNRKRMISIFNLVCLMANLSGIIYLHLFSFFYSPFTVVAFKSKKALKHMRDLCLYVFLFVMFGAHMAYVLYLFPHIPWPLVELFNIFCGVWMHLFFFSFMFYYGNFIVNVINHFYCGKSFIEKISICEPIRVLFSNGQVQVVITLLFTVMLSYIQWVSSDKLSVRTEAFNLRHSLNNTMKVVILSDLHSGASVYTNQVADVVDRANDLDADIIFLVGDTVDAPVENIKERVEPLRHLRSRVGTFLVTGNHEYYYGNWNDWATYFSEMGINVLQNSAKTVGSVCFVGLNDISSDKSGILNHFMDLDALNQCHQDDNVVVLEHNPAATTKILNASRELNYPVDLIISGHTHAGQFYVLVPYVYWALPYWYGIYDVGSSKLLVSAGTLYQAAPMKMFGITDLCGLGEGQAVTATQVMWDLFKALSYNTDPGCNKNFINV